MSVYPTRFLRKTGPLSEGHECGFGFTPKLVTSERYTDVSPPKATLKNKQFYKMRPKSSLTLASLVNTKEDKRSTYGRLRMEGSAAKHELEVP